MVDYAIVLVPSIDIHEEIIAKLRSLDLLSINQTKTEYVQFKPITVSIETKDQVQAQTVPKSNSEYGQQHNSTGLGSSDSP